MNIRRRRPFPRTVLLTVVPIVWLYAWVVPAHSAPPIIAQGGLVNAANFMGGPIAPESWVSLFGEELASTLVVASTTPLPTSLDGTHVTVTDSLGAERLAQLQFVAPGQLNFLAPPNMAPGPADVTVTNASGESASVEAQVAAVGPGIFSANASGIGPAAATFLRERADGSRVEGFTFRTDLPEGSRINIPIDLTEADDEVFVSFFGTGFRFQSSVSVLLGGADVPTVGAVAQGQFDGLDQLVVGPLPRSFLGRGEVTVLASFDGIPANEVTISIGPSEAPLELSGLRFDGTNDRVTVPYSPTFPTEVFTLSAWIKLLPPRRRAAIIARGEDDNSFNLSWQLYVIQDGTLEIMLEDSRENNYCYPLNSCRPLGSCSIEGDLFVADDVWRHVAATREQSGDLSLYIDGDKRASCEGTGVPSSNNFQVLSVGNTFGTIGPPPGGVEPPVWFFLGLIDEPAVWDVVLTDAQVAALWSSGVDAGSPGLVGYWNFDESDGQVVNDLSPAGNNGFLGGSPEPDEADPLWEAGVAQ